MLTLVSPKSSTDFRIVAEKNRIQLFLQYKKAEYTFSEPTETQIPFFLKQFNISEFPALVNSTSNEVFENSLHALREIEAEYPHPIGFIGPVESVLQSTAMLIPKKITTKNSEDILKLFSQIFDNIIDKIEYSDFLMGPTFTVADCVLAGDLNAMKTVYSITLPPEVSAYISRVENKCK